MFKFVVYNQGRVQKTHTTNTLTAGEERGWPTIKSRKQKMRPDLIWDRIWRGRSQTIMSPSESKWECLPLPTILSMKSWWGLVENRYEMTPEKQTHRRGQVLDCSTKLRAGREHNWATATMTQLPHPPPGRRAPGHLKTAASAPKAPAMSYW